MRTHCKRGHLYDREYGGKKNHCSTCRAANRKAKTAADTKWFSDYKKTLKCERCPENHPACLDFHHRDPKTKLFKVGGAAPSGMPQAKVMAEIAKCAVLCANCHRKEHS